MSQVPINAVTGQVTHYRSEQAVTRWNPQDGVERQESLKNWRCLGCEFLRAFRPPTQSYAAEAAPNGLV